MNRETRQQDAIMQKLGHAVAVQNDKDREKKMRAEIEFKKKEAEAAVVKRYRDEQHGMIPRLTHYEPLQVR